MRSVQQLMQLNGRSALVTGGGGHIGAAIAQALAEAGANVAIADRDLECLRQRCLELRSTGVKVTTHAVDLLDEAQVRRLPEEVHLAHGRIDILVNCAAFGGTTKLDGWAEPFEKQGTDAWRQALEVNITAIFELVQSSLPYLRASGHGTVINVGSIYGAVGPDWRLYDGTAMANPAAYGASKGAVIQFSRWLATTLAPDVRVNSMSPGGVFRNQPQSFVDRYIERTPMGRMAVEEDFKGAVVFLASDLSSYVTGIDLMVDGGWTAW